MNATLPWHGIEMLHQSKGRDEQGHQRATSLGFVLLPLLLTDMTALSEALHMAMHKVHHLEQQQQVRQHHCTT